MMLQPKQEKKNSMILLRRALVGFLNREFRSKAGPRNPGIQRRSKIFRQENPEIENLAINENILEDNEADFYNASKFYDQHIREERKLRKLIELKRIERKYFSPIKYPNLLTWSEKEQIRQLHYSEPSTWTPEKLALSFPATAEVIKKILKSQWAPMSAERIKKHDEIVSDNWKALERGELNLPGTLKSHIKNFVSRRDTNKINRIENAASLKRDNLKMLSNKHELSEFASIITSFEKKEKNADMLSNPIEKNEESPIHHNKMHVLSNEHYLPKRNKYYTLEELRSEAEKSLMKNNTSPSEIDEHFIKGTYKKDIKETRKPDIALMKDIPLQSTLDKYNNEKDHSISKHEEDDITLKIRIPHGKKKKGSIYKIKDCYYDDNGDFLYKVPGMM